MKRAGVLLALVMMASGALAEASRAQTSDPFVRPPPGRTPNARPQTPTRSTLSIETLARQGFEVKAMERGTGAKPNYLVILQRSGEIRTCIMRLSSDGNSNPRRESFCF